MVISAGMDLGSHIIHIAIVNGNEDILGVNHLSTEKEHSPTDLADLADRLVQFLSNYHIDRIVIEKPLVFAGQGFPALKMIELFAIVKIVAFRLNTEFIEVVPSSWRRDVIGSGRAKKADALKKVKVMGWKTKDHNEAESICIAMYKIKHSVQT